MRHPSAKLSAIATASHQQPMGSSAATSTMHMQPGIPHAGSASCPQPSNRQTLQHRDNGQPGKDSNHPGQEGARSAAPSTGLELLEVMLRKMPAATVAHYDGHIQVLRGLLGPLSLSNAAPLVSQLEEVLSAPLPAAAEAFVPADPRTTQNQQSPTSHTNGGASVASPQQLSGQHPPKKPRGSNSKPMPTLKAKFFTSPNVATASAMSDSEAKSGHTFKNQSGDVRGTDQVSGSNKGSDMNGGTAKRPSGVFAPRSRLWTAPQSSTVSHNPRDRASLRGAAAERVIRQQHDALPNSDGHHSSRSSNVQLPPPPPQTNPAPLAPPSPSRNPTDDSQQQQRRKPRWAPGEEAGQGSSSTLSAALGLARAKQVAAALVSAEPPPPPRQSEPPRAMETQGLIRPPKKPRLGSAPSRPPLHQQLPGSHSAVPANGGTDTRQQHQQHSNTEGSQDSDRMPQRVRLPNLGPAFRGVLSPTRLGNGKHPRGHDGSTASTQPSGTQQTSQPQTGNSNWGGVESSADWEPPTWAVSGHGGGPGGAPPADPRHPQVAPQPQPQLPPIQQSGPQPPSWEYSLSEACSRQPGGAAPATPPPPGSRFIRGSDGDLPRFPMAGACPAHPLQLAWHPARSLQLL